MPYTAWFGGIGSVIITLVAGFPVFLKGNWSTADFIASYIGIPIFIIPIIVWKLVYRTKVSLHKVFDALYFIILTYFLQFARAKDIDLWSGRLSEGEISGQESDREAV
jgi:amino acid transporter